MAGPFVGNCSIYCGSVTGVHSTCSMCGAPVVSITSRSKPSAQPLAGGMLRERGQELLVDRIALAVHALLLGHLGLEAAALLGRIGELAEAVGKLDAAGIELETLGYAWVRRRRPRQRCFDGRILGRESSAGQFRAEARPAPPGCG